MGGNDKQLCISLVIYHFTSNTCSWSNCKLNLPCIVIVGICNQERVVKFLLFSDGRVAICNLPCNLRYTISLVASCYSGTLFVLQHQAPWPKTTKYQGRFRFSVACTFNALPSSIRFRNNLKHFKVHAKCHFKDHFPS